jgi:hypothetical protein
MTASSDPRKSAPGRKAEHPDGPMGRSRSGASVGSFFRCLRLMQGRMGRLV